MATRKFIGDAWVELRGDPKKFRQDVQDAVTLDKRTEDQLAKNLQDSFDKAFDKLSTDKLMDKLSEVVVKLEIDTDHFRTQVQALNQIIDDEIKTVKIKVDIDNEALGEIQALKDIITEEVEHVEIVPVLNKERAEETEDDLDEVAKGRSAQVSPDYSSIMGEYVSARLAWLTRPRQVLIQTILSRTHFAEVVKALSGFRMLDHVRETVWRLVKDLDKSIPKITLMVGGFSYLSSVVLTAANNVFSLAYDTGRIAALALPLPGIFAGMALGIGTSVAALKDFNEVLPFVKEDMADIQDAISDAFWEVGEGGPRIENLFRYLSETTAPLFEELGGVLGSFFGKLAKDVQDIFTPEVFGRLFADLNESIFISAEFTEYWVNAFRILIELGSAYLPRLAEWAGNIGKQFESWLIAKEASGELVEWIEGGIVALHQFWDVLKNTGGVLKDFAQLAHETGGSTLVTLNKALLTIRETIADPTFRENFIGVFRGARDMMEEVAEKSGPAFKTAMDMLAKDVIYAFDSLGTGVGDILNGLFEGLARPDFSNGLRDFFDGISAGLSGLSEYVPSIAEGFGALLSILGTLAENFGPLLGRGLEILADLLIELEGPLKGLITGLSSILDFFLQLPGPVVITAGALLQFHTPLANVAKIITAIITSGGIRSFAAQMGALNTSLAMAGDTTHGFMSKVGVVASGAPAATTALAGTADAAGKVAPAAGKATTAVSLLGGALKTALLGAGIGLAIAGIAALIGQVAKETGRAKKDAEALKHGIDGLTGALNDAGKETVFLEILEKIGTEGAEALDNAGVGLDEFTAAIEKGPESVEELRLKLLALRDAGDITNSQFSKSWSALKQQAEAYELAAPEAEILAKAMESTGEAAENSVDGLDAATEAAERNAEANRLLRESHEKSGEAFLNSFDTTISYNNARKDLNALIEEGVGKWDLETEATQKLWSALSEVGDATNAQINNEIERNGLSEETIGKYQEMQTELYKSAKAAGMAEADALAFSEAAMSIPAETIATFLARDEVTDATMRISDELYEIDGATGTVFINGDVGTWKEMTTAVDDYLSETHGLDIEFDGTTVLEDIGTLYSALREKGIDVPFEIMNIESEEARFAAMLALLNTEQVVVPTALSQVNVGELVNKKVELENGEFIEVTAGMQISTDAQGNIATLTALDGQTYTTTMDLLTEGAQAGVDSVRDTAETPANMTLGLSTDDAYLKYAAMKADIRGDVATIDINAETDMAQAVFDGFKGRIRGAVATLDINAETDMGMAVLNGFIAAIVGASSRAVVRINAVPISADAILAGFIARVIGSSKQAIVRIDANPDLATRKLDSLIRAITVTKSIIIDALTGAATRKWQTLYNSIVSKTITIYVRRVDLNANGNLYPSIKSFAAGGLENHIAQIAPPSSMLRVWAEPETGGEAYIPLALSKRLRSLKILEDVAKIFGYMLVPNMKKFADGGLFESVALPSRSTTPISTISPDSSSRRGVNNTVVYNISMEINASDLEGIRSIEQFVQTVRRKTRQGIG